MLPSVNVIYRRIDQKFIPIFLTINERRESVCWERSVNISKLKKNNFLQESLLLTHHDSNNLLLQPENFYTTLRSAPSTKNHRSLQSGSRNGKSFSEYLMIHMI